MQISTSKGLIGIADPRWPESASVERLAMDSGFEAIVSTEVAGLLAKKDQLAMVVTKLEKQGSLQDIIAIMKAFGDRVAFVIRADASDMQSVTTLAQIPGVHVVSDNDFSKTTWLPVFEQAIEMPDSKPSVPEPPTEPTPQFVFVDPKSQQLLALVERLAVTKAAVLLQGATGSGKEVLAKTLHQLSDRANQPFVALNCAAMPEHLVEDMLFGHEKGAFTGASRELAGVFEQATGGTVFLDEIGEMPIQLQAKLLRVLQEKEVVRLGGRESIPLDFRLVAATNKDLKAGIADKTFREDLYYRISAFKLQVPALAERRGDIVPLANTLAIKHGISQPQFAEHALRQLYSYHWPGNVRELDNVIQRAVVFSNYGRIEAEHVFFDEPMVRPEVDATNSFMSPRFEPMRFADRPMESSMLPGGRDLQSAVRASEYDVIMEAIRSTRTREEAAKKLGISPRTLRYKMARLRDESPSMSHCA
jgi:two-component system, response regulator FlrC